MVLFGKRGVFMMNDEGVLVLTDDLFLDTLEADLRQLFADKVPVELLREVVRLTPIESRAALSKLVAEQLFMSKEIERLRVEMKAIEDRMRECALRQQSIEGEGLGAFRALLRQYSEARQALAAYKVGG